ncbi:MAG: PaaI family thioesterase [Ruegeria sp.]
MLHRPPLPLADLLGFRVEIDAERKQVSCLLEATEVHLNRHSVLHGGVAATLLDSASGMTASLTVDETGAMPFTTISLNINYLAPAAPGPLRAVANVTGGGRSLVFVEAALTDAQDRLIATSTGVFKQYRNPEAAA